MLLSIGFNFRSLSDESLPIIFPDDFDGVTFTLQISYTLLISGINILDSHGVIVFILDSWVHNVFIRKLVWMTMPVVTIKFNDCA